MIFGAITNSWRLQLESEELIDLVAQAEAQGAQHIELRQTCLGACESGQDDHWRPSLNGLKAIINAHPNLTFDLAMASPCLTQAVSPQSEIWQAALTGAILVGRDTPHLRLVDPAASGPPWQSPPDLPVPAWGLTDLAAEAARQGVTLSLENSGQPISSMALLIAAIREKMPTQYRPYLGLCPDPANQLRRFPDSQPLQDLAALPLDLLKIVHFKQMRHGEPIPAIADGDLDCRQMRDLLAAKGYTGPAIMEIPPHPEVFANLQASFAYLSP